MTKTMIISCSNAWLACLDLHFMTVTNKGGKFISVIASGVLRSLRSLQKNVQRSL